jgi:beta-galactosidase
VPALPLRGDVWLVPLLLTVGLTLDARAATYTPPASNRVSIPLSGRWRFLKADGAGAELLGFDDSFWSTVVVPHTWNSIDGQDGPDLGGDPNGRGYYRGVGTYRRHFTVPVGYAGRRIFLQFDGANLVTDVWVNGVYVGRHEGGFTAFRFDVTTLVATASGNDNVVTVKVDNANAVGIAPLSGDFTFFGGLYRDVSLVATDPLSADMLDYGSSGVYLSQRNVSQASADVTIKTLLRNANATTTAAAIKSVIVDQAGTIVQTLLTRLTLTANSGNVVVQNATIVNPHLWDGRTDPYLYSVFVEIHEGDETGPVRDLVPPQPLGFRSYSLNPNQGFLLNGHYLDLHGVNRHQDRLNKGWAISPSDQDQDMRLIEEIGATAIRLAHYPHAQYFYSLADKNGMIVWAEIPFVNGVGGQTFSTNAKQQLTELIRQSYNHPAIVFWSIGNEVMAESGHGDPKPLLTELNALARQEDPTRITTVASCCVPETDASTTITDTAGYNVYFGWYGGSYQDFASWADGLHRAIPARPFAVSEYGAGASIFLHAQNPSLSMTNHTEEYQALYHEAYWLAMKTRPFLWGKFVWNMFDFASDNRTEGDTNGRNDKGLVTYDRETRKDAFYWYKANWTTAPMVYVTSRRWTQRSASTTDVKVYSNADFVELLVNGVSLGTLAATSLPDRIFIWPGVGLTSGANTVQAIGRSGAVTVTDRVVWNLGVPKITISSPVNDDAFVAPGSIPIRATASDNSVTRVEFFSGAIKLGEDTNASDGWTLNWSNVPIGSYVLTARSTDVAGAATISPEVRVTVKDSSNAIPSVSVTSPANGSTVPVGSNLILVASALDSDGTVDRVTFFRGSTKLADDGYGGNGWSITLPNVTAGQYTFSARATDNLGGTAMSLPVTITVGGTGSQPPTIAVPATATPGTVTGTTTLLSVRGADDAGEPGLTYTWTAIGTPPAPVRFSVNGTNVAKDTVVTFIRAGNYTFQVTVQDGGGRTATSSVPVIVVQTLSGIVVTPATATVPAGGVLQFFASAVDQFAAALSQQPAFAWAVSAGGSISSSGLFTAGSTPGSGFVVSASAGGRAGGATVSVVAGGGFIANINFQLASAPPFPGYLVDGGAVYGNRGNGFTYGWSQDLASMSRDRNNPLSPDQRYDTLVHMGTQTWEIAVPNGTYSVHAVVGDPSYTDVNSKLTIEDVLTIDGTTSTANPWLQGTVTVTVSDGRLTIGNLAGSYNKICFIEIASLTVAPNVAPAVSISTPVSGATFTAPATIAIIATATDADGTVAKVEFFDGATKLGEDVNGSDGWSVLWQNVQAGSHTLTARAIDNSAAATVSSPVAITVTTPPLPPLNLPPAVGISSPGNGATFTAPVNISITATATDADGTIAKVEFFDGATKLGEDTNGSDGWSLFWPNVPVGTHTLTARATDNVAATATSSTVSITVNAPLPSGVIFIDVGSTVAFTDINGNVWLPDQFASGGTVSYKPNAIDNTVNDDLFRTYRYGNFSYGVPVTNGKYDVYLEFIETWWSAPGQRLFNVSAEGAPKLTNIDLFAMSGRFSALQLSFTVDVTDGVLNLSFQSLVDNAIVSAIAIVPR